VVWNSVNKGLKNQASVYWQMNDDPNQLHLKYFWAAPSTKLDIVTQGLGISGKYKFLNKGSLDFDVRAGELKLDGKHVGVWNGHPAKNKGLYFYGFTFDAPIEIDEGNMTISLVEQ
jgi:hypothetical protein